MSLTPIQRANLIWASRPPGPAPLWHAVGSAVRSLGGAIDALGVAIQGDCAHHERLPVPSTAVKVGDAAPAVDAASFVAPSARSRAALSLRCHSRHSAPPLAALAAMEKYLELNQLGKGSYGTVFLVRERQRGTKMCMKKARGPCSQTRSQGRC